VRDKGIGHRLRRALGEHAGLRRTGGRDIADGVDAEELCLEGPRIDGDPAVLRKAAGLDHLRSAVLRDAEKEIAGKLAAVVEDGDLASTVERADAAVRDKCDVALGKGSNEGVGCFERGRDGPPERDDDGDVATATNAARRQEIVQQQRRFARRRRAFERSRADADDDLAFGEGGKRVAGRRAPATE
jgi:hypothetical protein